MPALHVPARRRRARSVLVVLVLAAAAGGAFAGADVLATPGVSIAAPGTGAVASGALALQDAYVHALEVASPSVVEIVTASGLGSGVVYDAKGDVVTNAHVVGSATSFEVLLASGKRVAAKLVGAYVPDDLAVVRLTSPAGTKPASFADSSKLEVGDLVLAIGSPYGLAGSVTDGIVSSTGRSVSESGGVLLPDTIQTSAPINPGNSGGALVDISGKVVGIPTLAATDQQSGGTAAGIGFAIPSNTVRLIASQLISTGKVTKAGRAALGISGSTAADLSGNPAGVYVAAVQPGGPAARAGIAAGDVIVSVGSTEVRSFSELQAVLAGLRPGARVAVGVLLPSGATRSCTVVLGDLAAG